MRIDREIGEQHMKTEADIRILQPQTKEHLEPSEAGRSRALGGSVGFRFGKQRNFFCFKPHSLWWFF